MNDAEFREALLKRLDTLIHLLIAPPGASDDISLTEKVHRLVDHGLTTGEAAKILGKSQNSVSGIVAKRKKPRRKAPRKTK
ncbi:MAG: hypothetical protein AAFY56_16530 [Pseudomonadota bacterium]